ncbi:uncharacterized protein LOC105157933 [Sesamum indicum]|uniref:Uncharacterized protein LOC105157933 n=1 Tax=Sesamum indicum TaxID=4182 RepID=A0A6I9SRG0_SESIN|nr:uncharacterized protein LOC105157933 [Sesamum indicum]
MKMNLAPVIPSTVISVPLKFSTPLSSRFLPTIPKPLRTSTRFQISNSKIIPARDRVIDLGKYKGKMLGSLPSNYLKWVSKNLRAGDTEEWAKLADEVLRDPVYGDRMEWELAEKILNGNGASPNLRGRGRGNAVSELVELSERFGWDNEDKEGWRKIDFGLLGTSKGGRIPRVGACVEVGSVKKKEKKMVVEGERRRERRERMRERRMVGGRVEERNINGEGEGEERADGGSGSPFPGREALLRKVVNRRL